MRWVPYLLAGMLLATPAAAQEPAVRDLPGLEIETTRTMEFDTLQQNYIEVLAFCTQDLSTDVAERDVAFVKCMTDELAKHGIVVGGVRPAAETKIA